jgi:hypothetical protein
MAPPSAPDGTTIGFGSEGDEMDIGKCFRDAWGLFRLDWGPLVVTALIAAAVVEVVGLVVGMVLGRGVGAFTAFGFGGLGFGPALLATLFMAVVWVLAYAWMYAVTFHMVLCRVRERRAAEYADMLSFDQIGAFAVAAVVLGVIIGIGYLILVVPGLILTTIWLYALPLIGDRRLGVGDAMAESKDMAARPGFTTTFVAWLVGAIVVGVIFGILSVVPVIGAVLGVVAVPFGVAYVISMYFQASGEGHLVDAATGEAPSSPRSGG